MDNSTKISPTIQPSCFFLLNDFHDRHIVSMNEKEILYCSWEGAEVIEKHSSVWKTLSTKRVSNC